MARATGLMSSGGAVARALNPKTPAGDQKLQVPDHQAYRTKMDAKVRDAKPTNLTVSRTCVQWVQGTLPAVCSRIHGLQRGARVSLHLSRICGPRPAQGSSKSRRPGANCRKHLRFKAWCSSGPRQDTLRKTAAGPDSASLHALAAAVHARLASRRCASDNHVRHTASAAAPSAAEPRQGPVSTPQASPSFHCLSRQVPALGRSPVCAAAECGRTARLCAPCARGKGV